MDMENSRWKFNIWEEYSRKFQIATVRLHLYSIVILLTLIIYHPLNILLSIMSQWESLINLAMCKTEFWVYVSREQSDREQRGEKKTQYHCMSTSLPSSWENGTFLLHPHCWSRKVASQAVSAVKWLTYKATAMSLPLLYSPSLFKRRDRR